MSGFTKEEILRWGHGVWAEVDLGAIRHNIATLRSLAPDAEVMGVVKGYAYGHGNPASSRAMIDAGATRLGVARVSEALHLREAGVEVPIHVFTEPPPEAVPTLLDAGITPTVYTEAFARALADAAAARSRAVPVHVKLDTGMHRVGLMADDVVSAIRVLRDLPGLTIEGAWSHLAVADQVGNPFTQRQLDLFADLVGKIEAEGVELRYRHLANSAATLSLPDSHFDLVRTGVAAYGLWPGRELVGSADLRPAMRLRARVIQSKVVDAGERLSYGLHYELPHTGRVVTVPAGYADGYDRGLSGKADVLIAGARHRISGTVNMDQFMVDVGAAPVEIGDVVTLIGDDDSEYVTAEELAAHIGTINYEITARIAARVPRIYVDDTRGEPGEA